MGERRAPHSRQNLAWTGFSCWHRGHFMRTVPRSSASFDYAMLKLLKDLTQTVTLNLASELLRKRAAPCAVGGTLNGKGEGGGGSRHQQTFTTADVSRCSKLRLWRLDLLDQLVGAGDQ